MTCTPHILPNALLSHIFSFMELKDRYPLSMIEQLWTRVLYQTTSSPTLTKFDINHTTSFSHSCFKGIRPHRLSIIQHIGCDQCNYTWVNKLCDAISSDTKSSLVRFECQVKLDVTMLRGFHHLRALSVRQVKDTKDLTILATLTMLTELHMDIDNLQMITNIPPWIKTLQLNITCDISDIIIELAKIRLTKLQCLGLYSRRNMRKEYDSHQLISCVRLINLSLGSSLHKLILFNVIIEHDTPLNLSCLESLTMEAVCCTEEWMRLSLCNVSATLVLLCLRSLMTKFIDLFHPFLPCPHLQYIGLDDMIFSPRDLRLLPPSLKTIQIIYYGDLDINGVLSEMKTYYHLTHMAFVRRSEDDDIDRKISGSLTQRSLELKYLPMLCRLIIDDNSVSHVTGDIEGVEIVRHCSKSDLLFQDSVFCV